ncbi:MAG: DUF1816 domain-containing protein [Spirulina sp. SIO3F2]|nr:DUF1816 domain-containing protein [Spirulina sp. SIO3F2]
MNEIWLKFLEATGKAFWVEVKTTTPSCTYYFGPFANSPDAEIAIPGYVEDLTEEGAQGIQTQVRQMKPEALTIEHSLGEMSDHEVSPILRGQLS